MKTKLYLTVMLLFQAVVGLAQPGDIDITFNGSGIGAFGGSSIPNSPTPSSAQRAADGNVYNSRVYEDGAHKDKILIVGRFYTFNREVRKYIARLNPDGTVDTSFSGPAPANISGYIYTLELLADGKILIAGGFSITAGSTTYQNIARLNPDGDVDLTFNAGTGARGTGATSKVVHALAIDADGKILMGGAFDTYNGVACRRNMLRLEADGTIETAFNTAAGYVNGEIRAIALQGTKIIVGGFFSGFSYPSTPTPVPAGKKRSRVLRLNLDGTFDETFNPHGGVNGNNDTGATGGSGDGPGVYDLFVMPGGSGIHANRIYVVGKFTKYNGTDKVGVVRLLSEGGLDPTWNPGQTGLKIEELAASGSEPGYGYCAFTIKVQPDGNILIGGNFRQYNNEIFPKGIMRLKSPAGIRDTDFITGTGFIGGTNVFQGTSIVRDILMQSDGKVIVGGDFEQYNSTTRRMLARIKTRECIKAGVYTNGVWSEDGIPTDNTFYMAIAKGTFTVTTGVHMQACELEVKQGATLIIQSGASLTVNGIVMNNGTFTINNTGSLVQVKEDTKNADLGAGDFKMYRNTSPLKPYDYVYWSSPVENMTLHDLSPLTRADKYYKYSAAIDNWVEITGGYEVMVEGKGYIARAPSNHVSGPQSTFFQGRPHNGKITLPIVNSVGNFNLVGNPYPSAINANTFLNDTDNNTNIGGTIYLWSHATAISSSTPGDYQYNYSESDYVSYNKLGGTLTNPTGVLFAGNIAAGQSFFIEALSNTNVTFKNSMRLTRNNAQFYKNSSQQTVSQEPSRLWIDFYNAQGAYKQALVGFADGATMDMDRDYDGISMSGAVDFYSLVDDNKLVIQGRPLPFDNNQVVPMGYMTPAAGTFKIALNQFDGLFNDQTVYLVDHLTNSIHNLKSGSYTFNTMGGTHNNRFELRFTNETLSTVDHQVDSKTVIVSAKNNAVTVTADQNIDSVSIYDLTGKLLFSKKGIEAKSFATDQLNVQQQVVMVMIKFTNNQTLTKKVILQ